MSLIDHNHHTHRRIEIQIIEEKKRWEIGERQSLERLHEINSIPFEIKVLRGKP
jgi:hypothetical protein